VRALFFGSPQFAVPSLEALLAIASVAAVICQPDKPRGRGLELSSPAVKNRASELGLPVVQPSKLRTESFAQWARDQRVDLALVVAYGRILPAAILAAPRLGCVNVHASLLPKYRGAAPVTWAIVNGESETGVTLMKLDEGMDTGPTFARIATPIGPDESAGELSQRLAQLGAAAVRDWLPKYASGDCPVTAQDDARASMAPILEKKDGLVDFRATAARVHDHVRGMNPWPGAFTTARGRTVKVHRTRRVDGQRPATAPGSVLVADKSGVLVACGSGAVELVAVQPEGRRPMTGAEWAIGRAVAEGDVLGA
jgi:methionyl-tRNA formyltransferase